MRNTWDALESAETLLFWKCQILNASLFRITATLTSFKRLYSNFKEMPIHYYYVEVTYMPRLCIDAEQDLEVETALLCNSDMISGFYLQSLPSSIRNNSVFLNILWKSTVYVINSTVWYPSFSHQQYSTVPLLESSTVQYSTPPSVINRTVQYPPLHLTRDIP